MSPSRFAARAPAKTDSIRRSRRKPVPPSKIPSRVSAANPSTLQNPKPCARRKPVPPSKIPSRCVRRKSVPGSKFAAFWRIFVPGSNLPLRETPARSGEASPHEPTGSKNRHSERVTPAILSPVGQCNRRRDPGATNRRFFHPVLRALPPKLTDDKKRSSVPRG